MTLVKRSNNLFPTFFDDFFTKEFKNDMFGSAHQTVPSVNISSTDDAFVLEVAAPGYAKENFSIELNGDRLSITAKREDEQTEDNNGRKYTRREFNYENFTRVFTLPEKLVDGDGINAGYANGLLTVTVPKREEVKTKRLISIG